METGKEGNWERGRSNTEGCPSVYSQGLSPQVLNPVWFGKEEPLSPAFLLHWSSMAHGRPSLRLCILQSRWVGAGFLSGIREALGGKGKVQAEAETWFC